MIDESILATLQPTESARIMDLVERAGHDISDWANFKGGESKAASNPKYCYEWAYYQKGLPVILNLWFPDIKIDGNEVIFQDINMRSLSSNLSAIKGKKHVSKRAYNFDEGLKHAYRENLPVRIVVCEGSQSDVLNSDTPASQVSKRQLDPKTWSVSRYDMITGDCRIERKILSHFIDQHSLVDVIKAAQEVSISLAYIRQRSVRDAALAIAEGACELCGEAGFVTSGGYLYLETHHVIPLYQGGSDALDNVVALCPNDHKRAHFGKDYMEIRSQLQNIVSERKSASSGKCAPRK